MVSDHIAASWKLLRHYYKVAILTFKVDTTATPAYLIDLLQTHVPTRALTPTLVIPRTYTVHYCRDVSWRRSIVDRTLVSEGKLSLSCTHRQQKEVWDGVGQNHRGSGDGSPPVESRGKAPVGGLGAKSPRS